MERLNPFSRFYMSGFGIKAKLITIFVLIKVIPLIFLSWLAWHLVVQLTAALESQNAAMVVATREVVDKIGKFAVDDSVKALDDKSRESIERLTTDTAKAVAVFLYDRDRDIRMVAQLPPSEEAYRKVIFTFTRPVTEHGEWVLDSEGKAWIPANPDNGAGNEVFTKVKDNEKDWHYRKPDGFSKQVEQPLYLEITFIDLAGNEKIKVTSSDLMPKELRNVADKANTFCKAETYFDKLSALRPGEIYVSDVIGQYVGSPIIGPYTPKTAAEKGIDFAPEKAAYAGKENPVGIKFKGIIRWATPVVIDGQVAGYLTMALDHRHLSEFTNFIVPTEERYSTIPDAYSGNYAFIWDYAGRSIVHPRHHSIVGYDAATGEPAVPWLEEAIYSQWRESGLPLAEFLRNIPAFDHPSLDKKPAAELTKAGFVGLDGRYLNFAPQCAGWHELTEYGGSGSFLIFWSGLWKLTTAATIPYYSGQYGEQKRGFGYVTVGANVEEFHKPATETAKNITKMVDSYGKDIDERERANRQTVVDMMRQALNSLSVSTVIMSIIVIVVAVWMATFLTNRIKGMIAGISSFRQGNLAERLSVTSRDEMGDLAKAFNSMADSLQKSIADLKLARDKADEANRLKSEFLANMSHELRTPLNGIHGFAEALEMELENDPERREYAQIILESSEHLYRLVNDILDIAKIEAGHMEYNMEETAVSGIIQEVVHLHSLSAKHKDLALEVDISGDFPSKVMCDPSRIRQVLNNLVHNAIKFTDCGKVSILAELQGDKAVITVRDTGPGIDPPMQQAIFEKFRQGDAFINRRYTGTGLGLSLVRELVHGMGGEITLESKIGEGASFILKLPIKPGNR